jgi:hypothetical protein
MKRWPPRHGPCADRLLGHAWTLCSETITQLGALSNPNTSRTFARSLQLYAMIFAKRRPYSAGFRLLGR